MAKKSKTESKRKPNRPKDSSSKAFSNYARGFWYIALIGFTLFMVWYIFFIVPTLIPQFPDFSSLVNGTG